MCGIVGILSAEPDQVSHRQLKAMGDAIQHRGPDDDGRWVGANGRIGFAHRRLAIVDLSAAGHQPMVSRSGRFTLAYNGEIYNHLDLRSELDRSGALDWRGHSDTETLLACFEHWGVESTLVRAVGMFAIALWDEKDRRLLLARDRIGEKPLYYGWQRAAGRAAFLFGSDLAALRTHNAFEGVEDMGALQAFLRLGYVPAPKSIYKGISKLLPGHLLTLSFESREPILKPFWIAEMATRQPQFSGNPAEAVSDLEAILSRAVRRQMMSDVPLGAFLSGGVDSSTVVALMQANSGTPVKTFSIGFGDVEHNEAVHAAAVAKHLGTDHNELYVTPEMAMNVIPRLPSIYTEPFADSSQIPVCLVSALAREQVTVSLSGDAGDELFAGYNRYVLANRYFRSMRRIPRPLRKAAANAFGWVSPTRWSQLSRRFPHMGSLARLSEKMPKIQRALAANGPGALYESLVSLNPAAAELLPLEDRAFQGALPSELWSEDFVSEMMRRDLVTYLPDDILCKVDRAAMAVGLETRVPMLDHEVVEFAWSLPLAIKLKDDVGKWPLRELLYRHVPRELIERPKMGFSIPLDDWLRGPLRDWTQALLGERHDDALNDRAIARIWTHHREGEGDHGSALWPILMYRAWRHPV